MNKRHLHHFWTRFRRIKPWYFLVVALISAVVCVLALHDNNLHMLKLRSAVFSADQQNGDIEKPLKALQAYVTAHMNTDLSPNNSTVYPPIQLKSTYERLVQAQVEQVAQSNTKLYSDAQTYCEQQNSTDISGRNRVPCIDQYVQSHNRQAAPPIPDALYKFAFVTPIWSPDLAGWSMVVAMLSGIIGAVFFVLDRWFKRTIA